MSKLKFYICVLFYFSLFTPSFAQAPDWGVADTLEHHLIGPGIQYSKIFFTGKKMLIWVTAIDLTNPYNKIEQSQSRQQVPDLARWTVQQYFSQNSRSGHKVCAAFNHDFFSYEHGIAIGMNVSEGEVAYGSGWGRSLLTINDDKVAGVINPVLEANVVLTNGSKVKIDWFNANALGLNGDCILFNRFNSLTLSEAGKYIKVKPENIWTVNGPDIQCKVLAISDSPIQTSQTEYIIFLRGTKLNSLDGKLSVGDHLAISQKMLNGKFGTPLTNIISAFHGYPSIAYEGKLHQGEYNDFEGGREYEVSSRQMAGMSQDGKTVYIVTTEMSSTSVGVNCIDITNYMLAHGSWNVVNFDSGGSVAIVVDNQMLNYPARDAVRPVEDALLAVSLAPESTEINSYAFIRPAINPTIVSLVPLKLLAHNKYNEVLERDVKGFTFTCEPSSLGRVDENYIFHAGTQPITGKIVAEKDGKMTELIVRIQMASDVSLQPNKILIDKNRSYPIAIQCKIGLSTYPMDPIAFTWTVSDQSICEVKEGVLRGLSNGHATLTAKLNNIEKVMDVTVEIGKDQVVCETFADMTTFSTLSAGVNNLKFLTPELPIGWTDGVNLNFDFIGNRLPFIELKKSIQFFGLPDSISWDMQESTGSLIKEVQVYLSSSTNPTYKTLLIKPHVGVDASFVIPFATADQLWNITDFPIRLTKVKLVFNGAAPLQKYNVSLRALKAYYPEKLQTDVSNPFVDNKMFWISRNPGALNFVLHYQLTTLSNVGIKVFGVDGKIYQEFAPEHQVGGLHEKHLKVFNLPSGIYIVQLAVNNEFFRRRIVVGMSN